MKFRNDLITDDENGPGILIKTLIKSYKNWYFGMYNKNTTKPSGIIDYFAGETFIIDKKDKKIKGIKIDMSDFSESFKSDLDR